MNPRMSLTIFLSVCTAQTQSFQLMSSNVAKMLICLHTVINLATGTARVNGSVSSWFNELSPGAYQSSYTALVNMFCFKHHKMDHE